MKNLSYAFEEKRGRKVSFYRNLIIPLTLLLLSFASPNTSFATTTTTSFPITGSADVCEGDVITYTAPTSNNTYVWTVSPGNSFIANSNTNQVTWGAAGGGHFVELKVYQNGNLISTDIINVTIHGTPEPVITSDFNSDCIIPDDRMGDTPVGDDTTLSPCHTVCEGTPVTYTTPLVSGNSYSWSVTGNFTSIANGNTNQATITWGSPGQASVTVTETTPQGCSSTETICIEIVAKPNSLFHVNTATGPVSSVTSGIIPTIDVCLGEQVCFWEDATGEIAYNWSFGNGTNSIAANDCATFNSPGVYVVKLQVENECHCTDESFIKINVTDLPGPEIVCTNVMCENGTFSYNAIMPNGPCPGGTYDWIVSGNGSIVEANGSPITPTISHSGIGITAITVDWASGPIGTISLRVSNCNNVCSQFTTVDIPIIPSVIDISGDDILCVDEDGYFSVQCFPGTTYDWMIDGGSIGQTGNDIWHSFPATGTHTISVSYTNPYLNCTGMSNTFTVEVLDDFEITGPEKICEGSTANIIASSGTNFIWEIKDNTGTVISSVPGGSSYNFSALPGNYTVLAYDAASPRDFCNEYAVHGITVIASPPAPTNINGVFDVCALETYIYTAAPTSTDYYLKWEIIDNSSTTTFNGNSVTTSWTNPTGPVNIRLYQVSKDNDCESLPYEVDVTIKNIPSVSITAAQNPVCANTSSLSPEIYTASPSNFDNYTWSISPPTAGSVVSGQGTDVIGVIWNNTSGTAVISVDANVCTSPAVNDTYTATITPPTPFTISGPTTICQGDPGVWTTSLSGTFNWDIINTLTNSSIASGSGITSILNYTFNQHGSFVLVIDGSVTGCNGIATETHNITVNPAPVANLSYTGDIDCIVQSNVNLIVSVQGTAPYSYQWYQNTSPAVPATNTSTRNLGSSATNVGSWYVVITDANGCTATTNTIFVGDECPNGPNPCVPVPGYYEFDTTNYIITNCTDLDFQAMPFNGVPAATSFTWQIANIATLSGPNPSYTFPASGIYPVSLITTYQSGPPVECSKVFTQDVLVPVQADMDINLHCVGNVMNVDLINTTNVVHGPLSLWNHRWRIFDSGGTQVGPNYTTQDVLNVPGLTPGATYTVRLRVWRSYTWNGQTINAQCRIEQTFTVPLPPNAAFTVNPFPDVCEDLPVTFTDASTPAANITAWSWDFGDGSGITTQHPEKTYQLSGTTVEPKNIVLTVTDEYGCTSTSPITTVNVHPNQIAGTFSGIPSGPICPGTSANITFNATGSSGYSYQWVPSGVTTSNISVNQTSNNYIFVTDVYNCYREFGPAIVEVDEIPDPFIQGDDIYCDGDEIQLSSNYGPQYSYQWYEGGSILTGETNTTLNVTMPVGTYSYTVELTSASSCTKLSIPFSVTVNALPAPPIVSINPSSACPSTPITLSVTNSSNYSFIEWTDGSSGSSMTTTTPGVYYAVGTDVNGCSSSASGEVFELPDFCGFMCGCYSDCIDAGSTFSFPGITGTYQYWEWQQYTGGSWNAIASQTGTGPVAPFTATTPGNYVIRLYVVTLDGCDGTSCEADIDLIDCSNSGGGDLPPCEGTATMDYMDCSADVTGLAQYEFILSLNLTPFGAPCANYNYTIIAPSGNLVNVAPGQLTNGSNTITGFWQTGVAYFPGQTVCFTVIVTNSCDQTQCSYDVCYDVEPCGDASSGGGGDLGIAPCEYGDAFVENVFCSIDANGNAQYNFDLTMNFAAFGANCNHFTYSVVPPSGNVLMYTSPFITGSGSYNAAGTWSTGQPFIPGQVICFNVVMTNTCDQTQCTMVVCFDVPPCGTNVDGSSGRRKSPSVLEAESEIVIYPNPASDELKVVLPLEGDYIINMYDMSGKLVFKQEQDVLSRQVVKLDIESLKPGVYTIQCIGNSMIKNEIIKIE